MLVLLIQPYEVSEFKHSLTSFREYGSGVGAGKRIISCPERLRHRSSTGWRHSGCYSMPAKAAVSYTLYQLQFKLSLA
jgi:hypothetical protein